ncbi:MAG: hypothetical protein R2705_11465 [Ilumatobacteraceae bacterium]
MIETIELRQVHLPLVVPFRTSAGVEHERDALLVRVTARDLGGRHHDGWGNAWRWRRRSTPPSTPTAHKR